MKIVFFGTPEYVLPVLEKLYKEFRTSKLASPIVAVVTQSPKPTDRKQVLTYSPVDAWAHQHKIPIYYHPSDLIKDCVKADLGVIAAYGALLPPNLVNYFPYGILVIHPSLLPEFRWGSPVQAAIVTGTNPTGVSIIKMDAKFDHGPIISQFKEDVLPDDTTGSLRARLFIRSAEVLAQLVKPYVQGKITPRKQDEAKATFARVIKKVDAFIPSQMLKLALEGKKGRTKWPVPFITAFKKTPDSQSGDELNADMSSSLRRGNRGLKSAEDVIKNYSLLPSALSLDRFIRAMNPWPCAWTYVSGISPEQKRLKIISGHFEKNKLVLNKVQLEGKEAVSWKQFKEGYPKASF